MLVGKHKRRTMLCKNSCRKIRKPKLHSTVRQDLLRPASDYFTSGYWPSQFGRRLLSASYAVYLRCTPIREICPIWRFWRPQKSVSYALSMGLTGSNPTRASKLPVSNQRITTFAGFPPSPTWEHLGTTWPWKTDSEIRIVPRVRELYAPRRTDAGVT